MKNAKEEFEMITRIIKSAEMDGAKFIGADRFVIDNVNGKLKFSLNFEQSYNGDENKEGDEVVEIG